jgi:hypothetical protein
VIIALGAYVSLTTTKVGGKISDRTCYNIIDFIIVVIIRYVIFTAILCDGSKMNAIRKWFYGIISNLAKPCPYFYLEKGTPKFEMSVQQLHR